MSGSTAELRILITSKDSASKVIAGLGKNLGGLGVAGKVATAALAGIAVAGGALAGIIGKSVGAAMDFEGAMSAVGAVANASGAELDQLSQLALDLGQNVKLAGISASDAGRAMAALASGGISTEDILRGAAEGALLLASSAGIDVAQAAEIAAAALANFGLAGTEAGHIADLFSAASNSSAVTVGDLGESMKYIGPIANAMGLSIEEVTAALAELGDQGIKGSQAGTALRSILSSLAKPSKQASALIKELGLEFFDAGGKMKSIAGISEQLKTQLGGLTDQQRANALVTLFGNEALSAATVLYGEGADGIAKYLGQVNVAGSAAANGAKRNDNLKGSIEQLKSSWETASIVLGTAFIPLIRQMVDMLSGAVNAAIPLIAAFGPRFVAAIQSGIGRAVAIVQTFAAAVVATVNSIRTGDFSNLFGPLIVAISTAFGSETAGKVTLFVSKLVTNLKLARDAVLTAKAAFAGDWVSAESIATPVRIVGEVFLALGNAVRTAKGWLDQLPAPVLAAAAAFLALGPALKIAAVVLPALIGALTGLGPIISFIGATIPIVGGVIAALGGPLTLALVAVGLLAAAWATNFMGIRDATLPAITAIQGAITTQLMPALSGIGPFLATNVMPGWQLAWAGMQTAVSSAMVAITPAVQAFIGFVQGSLLPGLQGIMAVAGPAFDQMKAAAVGAFQAALPGLQAFAAGVQQWASAALPIIQQVARAIMDDLGPAVMAIVGWAQTVIPQFAAAFSNVMSIVGPIIGALAGLIGGALSAIAGFVSDHSAQITSVLTNAWNIISNTIGIVFAVISGVISATLQAISGDWEGAWETIKQTAATVWDGIKEIVSSAIEIVKNLITIGLDAAKIVALAAWEAIKVAAQTAWEGIKTLISTAIDALKTTISDGLNAAKDTAKTALDAMATAATTAMDNLKTAISNGIAAAKDTITTGVSGFAGIVLGVGDAMYSAGASIIGRLAAGIESAIGQAIDKVKAGLDAIANLLPHSDPKDPQSPLRGLTDAGRAIFTMLGEGISKGAPEAVKAAADAASAVAKAITDSIGAITALASFDVAKNTPTAGQFGAVAAFVANATAMIAQIGAQFSEEALKAAGDFADAAGKVVGLIGNGVKGLMALTDFVPPANAAIYAFGKSLRSLINDIALLAEQVTQEAVDQAAAFAEGAGKVVAILGNGVSGFTALIDFVAPAAAAIYAFGKTLRLVINDFALLAEQITQEATDQAAKFATGAGAVVGMIGNGVAGFTALAEFVAPAASAIYAFGKTLRAVINDLALVAEQVTQEAGEAAALFATSAGSVVGIIGNAVDGLSKLLDFVAPSEEAINNFVYAIATTVRKIAEMASQMSTEGIALAGEFGDAAGSVFAALKDALSVFTDLHELVVPSAQAIDNFGIAVAYTVRRLGQFADELGKDGIEQATKFGASVGAIFGSLKSAMDILTNLAKFKDVASKAFDSLLVGMQEAIDRAQGMVQFAKNLVTEAEQYRDLMSKAAAIFNQGMSLGGSPQRLGESIGEGIASGARDALDSHSPSQVMAQIGRDVIDGLVQGMGAVEQDAVERAARVASAVADAIASGVAAFTALGGFVAPGAGSIAAFGQTLKLAVNDLAVLAGAIGQEMLDAAAKFSEGATKAVGIFGQGVSGLTGLGAFVAPAAASIYAFGKTLRLALNDLAILAEQLTTETSDLAGRFGEGASKAVAVLAGGVAGFATLRDFVPPLNASIYAFGKAVRSFVADLAIVAEQIGVDTAELAGKFADGAGKAVALIGPAIGGFVGLSTFVTPGRAAVDGLLATVRYIIARFGEMAQTMSTEGTKQLGDFGAATNAVLGGVKAAIDTFIALDKAVVPRTGDLSDLVLAVQGVTRNMAVAAATLGDDAIKDATAFGTAAQGIFTALKSGLDLFVQIDKPGGWPTTDWLQPLIELMAGVLLRGGQLLTQSQQLKAIADQFSANLMQAGATFGGALGLGDWALTGNVGGGIGGGGGGTTTIINNYISGNTLLNKDTGTQQMVTGIVTATQGRTISYATSG